MNNLQVQAQTVFIVDDDTAICEAMGMLLDSVDLSHRAFNSASEFLESHSENDNGCLVLDIRMPGLSGLELQEQLNAMGSSIPIIFITGHGDVPMAVEAMQNGAVDFIQKPFRDQVLLDRISDALKLADERYTEHERTTEIKACVALLTPREKDVLELVVTGKPNKIIAHELDVSQRTVEIHRARVMDKMQARSLAELVRMSVSIQS